MKNPTYREQFNKIVRAYLRNELSPMNSCACFIGNLLNGRSEWGLLRHFSSEHNIQDALKCLKEEANNFYSPEDIQQLECTFMSWGIGDIFKNSITDEFKNEPDYEDRLYRAMERALLHLRRLHESKGEIIEDYEFTRRDLSLTNSVS